jgi:hypothetical protein
MKYIIIIFSAIFIVTAAAQDIPSFDGMFGG